MQKKISATAIIITLVLGMLGAVHLFRPTQAVSPLDMEITCGGTVDKKPSESFTVEITFKNKGTIKGTWKVAVTFEGDDWTWKAEGKLLALESCEKKTLVWEGVVPEDAVVDSVARLIVYYDDDVVALNWWIHVIPGAELFIVNSKVS
jgi:hypothetical protein